MKAYERIKINLKSGYSYEAEIEKDSLQNGSIGEREYYSYVTMYAGISLVNADIVASIERL